MRHFKFALHIQWEERVRGRHGRPGVLIGTEKPDCIRGESRRLCGSGNLNGDVGRLRREENFVGGMLQLGEELTPGCAPSIEAERAHRIEGLRPTAMSL